MATSKRRRRHARAGNELSTEQAFDLILGNAGAFSDPAEREAAWWAHREELLAAVNPTTRPAAWWRYEMHCEPPRAAEGQRILAERGLLTDHERSLLRKWDISAPKQDRAAPIPPHVEFSDRVGGA